ncbi:hypothetical protein QFC19_007846 [Naganishia cerealis]|uniref:Uncharacterized protein n=1 Tax=Naganishia cerealis TaxID=610337 RepID=A0ACC2V693_9TREE|nr:hypothetical protein QFC19_007846 [Naganishia cerealis]
MRCRPRFLRKRSRRRTFVPATSHQLTSAVDDAGVIGIDEEFRLEVGGDREGDNNDANEDEGDVDDEGLKEWSNRWILRSVFGDGVHDVSSVINEAVVDAVDWSDWAARRSVTDSPLREERQEENGTLSEDRNGVGR